MVEVKHVIDNAAGFIPVPASELEFSRAVFRTGESEYRLAGRPCRLTDMQELLVLDPIHEVDATGWPNRRPAL